MVPLIEPVSKSKLMEEIKPEMVVCEFKGVQICIFRAEEAPSVMQEIGRLREQEFRRVGAGRNVATDIDDRDSGEHSYNQLIAWDPINAEVVATYRYLLAGDLPKASQFSHLRTSTLFKFTPELMKDYLPYSMELGRSVVNQDAKRKAVGLYALWKGLGAFICEYSDLKYFFGNFTVYKTSPRSVTKAACDFLNRYHAPQKPLLTAYSCGEVTEQKGAINFCGKYEDDYKKLHEFSRS